MVGSIGVIVWHEIRSDGLDLAGHMDSLGLKLFGEGKQAVGGISIVTFGALGFALLIDVSLSVQGVYDVRDIIGGKVEHRGLWTSDLFWTKYSRWAEQCQVGKL